MDMRRSVNRKRDSNRSGFTETNEHKRNDYKSLTSTILVDKKNRANVRWIRSYDGSRIGFLGGHISVIQCKDYLKFFFDKKEIIYCSHGRGIHTFATHPNQSIFAYTENAPKPVLFILQYPDFNIINKIEDDELLEYQLIEFSNSNLMATISGIPKFALTIWKFTDLTKVYSVDLPHVKPSFVSFCPSNPTIFALCYPDHIDAWTFDLSPKARTVRQIFKAPSLETKQVEEWQELQTLMSFSTNDFMKSYLNMPNFTMTDYSPDDFEKFLEDMQAANRVTFETFTWTHEESLVVACSQGHLLKIKMDDASIVPLKRLTQVAPKTPQTTSTTAASLGLPLSLAVSNSSRLKSTSNYSSVGEAERTSNFDIVMAESHLLERPTCIVQAKKNLIVGMSNGSIKYLELVGENGYAEVKAYNVNDEISSFSPSVTQIYVGTKEGGLYALSSSRTDQLPIEKFRYNTSPICHIDVFYTAKPLFVTMKKSGLVEAWNQRGERVSKMSIDSRMEVTCMAASGFVNLIAVGTKSGLVYLGIFEPNTPSRWLYPRKIHYQPVHSINHQDIHLDGSFFRGSPFFLVAHEDAKLFFVCGAASQSFNTVAYMDLKSDGLEEIVEVSVSETHKNSCVCILGRNRTDGLALVCFSFNSHTLVKRPDYLVDAHFKFKDKYLRKSICKVDEKVISMALFGKRFLAMMCGDRKMKVMKIVYEKESKAESAHHSKKSSEFEGSETDSVKIKDVKLRLSSINSLSEQDAVEGAPEDEVIRIDASKINSVLKHERSFGPFCMEGNRVRSAFVPNWLLSAWKSGVVMIHNVFTGTLLWKSKGFGFWEGGVREICLSADGSSVAYAGTGVFCCSEVNPNKKGTLTQNDLIKNREMVHRNLTETKREHRHEHIQMESMRTMTDTYVDVASSVVPAPADSEIAEQIEAAIEANLIYNPSIEKPSIYSSWMQTRELKKLAQDELVYGPVRYSLRAKVWKLRQKLKQLMKENDEASDLEKIPFQEFNLDLQQQRLFKEECEAEVAKMKKSKEMENSKKRKLVEMIKALCWDSMDVKGREIEAFAGDYCVSNFPMRERKEEEVKELKAVQAHRRVELADQMMRVQLGEQFLTSKKSKQSRKSDEEVDKEDAAMEKRNKGSFYGSLGYKYGGDSELFYSQFEVCTKWHKIRQIVMLKDSIHRIQVEFNKDFDEMMKNKMMEIQTISKRNKRIKSIMKDLGMPTDEVLEPWLSDVEQPELLFVTNDEEVKTKKMFGVGNKEEVVGQDEKREEGADDWRERGLEKMMGGLLEIKKEDELKKDIPVPAFINEKAEEKWTDEEKKAAAEYKTQLKTQEEEREKYKKVLDMELRKLQAANAEGMKRFDTSLFEFFHHKILVQSSVYQTELMILRLRYSMLLEQMMDKEEDYLRTHLESLKESLNETTLTLMQAKNQHESFQAVFDSHVEVDKMHDKMFKKKFQELPQPVVDTLYKLYKKRPKALKPNLEHTGFENLDTDPTQELDHPKNMPEGINLNQWAQFCTYRHEKISKEAFLRSKQVTLTELQKEHLMEQKRLDVAKQNLDDTFNAINQLSTHRYQYYRNVELQLLMKQGQVEVDQSSSMFNFKSCLLIHRDVIEELNKNIKVIGENKIATMIESKDFKKGIAQLEWEHRKMEMELQDLKSKMKDIDNFKVTKEVLFFLKRDNYDEIKVQEIMTLEKTLNMAKTYHAKNMQNKNNRLEDLNKSIKTLTANNDKLKEELKAVNESILVRKKLHEVVVDKSGMAKIEVAKRHKMMVEKRRLLEVSKTQAEEIACLKEQLEKLRRKTFPALDLDHQAYK